MMLESENRFTRVVHECNNDEKNDDVIVMDLETQINMLK